MFSAAALSGAGVLPFNGLLSMLGTANKQSTLAG